MMKRYPRVKNLLRPVLGVAMPRAGRLYAPGGTVHVVARCNNRELYFTTPEKGTGHLSDRNCLISLGLVFNSSQGRCRAGR
jgi:hypothetical protein